ncbi:asparaginase [Halalkalibacterium halodurans]|uniref:asparaginase n=1 Tax=Halalkalibacterium halodurans TaxID=86665 RepID=UPI002AAA28D9|nr:asparaginase [Halalkalibacterium halodurans]MDY7221220.1 asparaginase [Halalkalibacterium halodurans]MDY7240459.1 asparaginase [Halalkalibacterium halodurans]
MKKLLLLTTGGTIASIEGENGLVPGMNANDLLNYLPGIDLLCEIDGYPLMNLDSTNIQPEHWVDIANAIYERYDDYDGFVITHGTDTMAYTAAAISYMLQHANKPIVLTGSQIPIGFEKTDAKRNILDAIRFACEETGGVYVVFDGRVIQGTRAIKLRTKSYDSFESINFPYVASIYEDSIEYNKPIHMAKNQKPTLDTALCTDVALVKLHPGIQPELFDYLKEHYKGIVIESYGSGGIPFQGRNLLAKLNDLTDCGISVVITTQCLEEGEDIEIYEVGRNVNPNRIIRSRNMNTEAIVPKLMWVLGKTQDPHMVKKLMETPIADDVNF